MFQVTQYLIEIGYYLCKCVSDLSNYRSSIYTTDCPSDYWLTIQVLACPGQVVQAKPSIHTSLIGLVGWLYMYFKHLLDVMTSFFWVKVREMEATSRHDHCCWPGTLSINSNKQNAKIGPGWVLTYEMGM